MTGSFPNKILLLA